MSNSKEIQPEYNMAVPSSQGYIHKFKNYLKYTVGPRLGAQQIMATYPLNCMFLCLGNGCSSVSAPFTCSSSEQFGE